MHIAVCDDNELFLSGIGEQIQAIPMVETLSIFSNYNRFLFSIDEGRRYDAILLDIEWEQELSGMDIAEELYRLCPESRIIFVTGHGERFSQHIFLHRASLSGFLTKPVDQELLRANLQKIADAPPYEEPPALVLRQRGTPISIPLREISHIESKGHTISVHAAHATVTAYERLDRVMQMLTTSFYQCHKSFIVNMDKIRRFQSSTILLKNGEEIPVSRARYTGTKEAYFQYMSQSF